MAPHMSSMFRQGLAGAMIARGLMVIDRKGHKLTATSRGQTNQRPKKVITPSLGAALTKPSLRPVKTKDADEEIIQATIHSPLLITFNAARYEDRLNTTGSNALEYPEQIKKKLDEFHQKQKSEVNTEHPPEPVTSSEVAKMLAFRRLLSATTSQLSATESPLPDLNDFQVLVATMFCRKAEAGPNMGGVVCAHSESEAHDIILHSVILYGQIYQNASIDRDFQWLAILSLMAKFQDPTRVYISRSLCDVFVATPGHDLDVQACDSRLSSAEKKVFENFLLREITLWVSPDYLQRCRGLLQNTEVPNTTPYINGLMTVSELIDLQKRIAEANDLTPAT